MWAGGWLACARLCWRWRLALNANNAKWSPDGSRIAFNSHDETQPGENANLFTMNSHGSGLVQLTHFSAGDANAHLGCWSHDGKRLVFELRGANGVSQLFIVDADGHHLRQLTRLPDGANPSHASWSPIG